MHRAPESLTAETHIEAVGLSMRKAPEISTTAKILSCEPDHLHNHIGLASTRLACNQRHSLEEIGFSAAATDTQASKQTNKATKQLIKDKSANRNTTH